MTKLNLQQHSRRPKNNKSHREEVVLVQPAHGGEHLQVRAPSKVSDLAPTHDERLDTRLSLTL